MKILSKFYRVRQSLIEAQATVANGYGLDAIDFDALGVGAVMPSDIAALDIPASGSNSGLFTRFPATLSRQQFSACDYAAG